MTDLIKETWSSAKKASFSELEYILETKVLPELQKTLSKEASCAAIYDFLMPITDIYDTEGAPDDYLGFIAAGSFKECYDPNIPGWIVKFYSSDNNTDEEKAILNCAASHSLDQIFVPSYFIEFPFELPLTHLDGDYIYTQGEREGTSLVGLILQPEVKTFSNTNYPSKKDLIISPSGSVQRPGACIAENLLDSQGKPFDSEREIFVKSPLKWAQDCINYYGDEIFNDLNKFCADFEIFDLHGKNVGYTFTDNRPIILDWLSGF